MLFGKRLHTEQEHGLYVLYGSFCGRVLVRHLNLLRRSASGVHLLDKKIIIFAGQKVSSVAAQKTQTHTPTTQKSGTQIPARTGLLKGRSMMSLVCQPLVFV